MARDILSQYGPGSSQPQRSSASCGGVLPGETKDVMNYSPPYGPKGINDPQGPGIHGQNSGIANRPTSTSDRGTPISGAINRGNSGSQGRY